MSFDASQFKWLLEPKYLSAWLVFVAFARSFAVFLGYFVPSKVVVGFFRGPAASLPKGGQHITSYENSYFNRLVGRTWAIWTAVTCTVCLVAAGNVENNAVLALTIATFYIANFYFVIEFITGTVTIKSLITPCLFSNMSIALLTYVLVQRGYWPGALLSIVNNPLQSIGLGEWAPTKGEL